VPNSSRLPFWIRDLLKAWRFAPFLKYVLQSIRRDKVIECHWSEQ
jgi:hypothetical protein